MLFHAQLTKNEGVEQELLANLVAERKEKAWASERRRTSIVEEHVRETVLASDEASAG